MCGLFGLPDHSEFCEHHSDVKVFTPSHHEHSSRTNTGAADWWSTRAVKYTSCVSLLYFFKH